jgi:hypothetical protein
LNIPFNGQETISREPSLTLQVTFLSSTTTEKTFWLQSKSSTSKILQL